MTGNTLEIRGLTTQFTGKGWTARAVDGIDLDVRKGEILGLVGESGSGKSVTGFSIMGLIDPPGEVVAGSIRLDGEELSGKTDAQMARLRGNRLAMIFQDPLMTLNPVLRIDTQMVEAIRLHRKMPKREALALAEKGLAEVGIPSPAARLKNYPHELSGGMRQRVAIAIALLNEPDLIIADEPTTALDVTIQAQILYLVQKLARERGTSLIWITHDLGVAAELADRIAVMYAGRIVEEGPADEVLDRPKHPYTDGLLKSLPEGQAPKGRLYQISGMTPSLTSLPPGCPFAPRCENATALCQTAPEERTFGEVRFRCHHPAHMPEGAEVRG